MVSKRANIAFFGKELCLFEGGALIVLANFYRDYGYLGSYAYQELQSKQTQYEGCYLNLFYISEQVNTISHSIKALHRTQHLLEVGICRYTHIRTGGCHPLLKIELCTQQFFCVNCLQPRAQAGYVPTTEQYPSWKLTEPFQNYCTYKSKTISTNYVHRYR